MHDLVIRGGTVVDGSGGRRGEADVAVDGDRITAVGTVAGRAREEIDARGLLVTPGFVDIHTHYDGQALWDPILAPSSWHGVTTLVVGNCGVGFAPARPDRHDWLIGLMQGVEDIPGESLAAGLPWDWESFPEYLDALARRPHLVDVGAYVAHGPLRAYVMGDRGARNEPRDRRRHRDDGAPRARGGRGRRARLLDLAHQRSPRGRRRAGARARSRARTSCSRSGARSPSAGRGIFEVAQAGTGGRTAGDAPNAAEGELRWMRRLAAETQRPVSFLLFDERPDGDAVAPAAGAHRRGRGVGGAAGAADREPPVRHAGRPPDAREPVRRAADLPGDRVAAARGARRPPARRRRPRTHPRRASPRPAGARHARRALRRRR